MNSKKFIFKKFPHLKASKNPVINIDIQCLSELLDEYANIHHRKVVREVIMKVESTKGLAGKMAMANWSSMFIKLLKKLIH